MEEETRKENGQKPMEEEVRPVRRQKRISKSLHDFLGGDYLSRESVFRNLPFLLFLAILAVFYIGNTYYAEKTFKEIERTKAELKELRYQYITAKEALMYNSRLTEVAKRVTACGLKETTLPPWKIYYSAKSLKTALDPDTKKE
jgi:hypothetical protein